MQYRILLVEDEAELRLATQFYLEQEGFIVDTAESGIEALKFVQQPNTEYAVIVLDYNMPIKNGAETAKEIRLHNQEAIILFYSEDKTREAIKEAWNAGAVGFIDKDSSHDEFLQSVRNNCRKYEETTKIVKSRAPNTSNEKLIASIGMVGRSKALAEIAIRIPTIRNSDETVLILGDSGTGKELIAKALHKGSGPFVAINCATYKGNTSLLESELFGYEKGAFTGAATNGQIGLIEYARGGTVFFDEIHHLSLEAQAKLLRLFQEKTIRRVGGKQEYKVDFRIIVAGKPDLEEAMNNQDFLKDIFYRIDRLRIEIPRLSERVEDIEPLVAFYSEQHFKRTGIKKHFLMKTVRYFENFAWKGNIRDLDNEIIKILVESPNKIITPEELPDKFFAAPSAKETNFFLLEQKHQLEKRELLISALNRANWKAVRAAKEIGVPPSTMYSLMEKFRIDRPSESQTA